MSRETNEELWARLVREHKAEWRPGMLATSFHGRVISSCDLGQECHEHPLHAEGFERRVVTAPPDFDDDATKGCLTKIARDLWTAAYLVAEPFEHDHGVGWRVRPAPWMKPIEETEADDEARALLEAIDAAPGTA